MSAVLVKRLESRFGRGLVEALFHVIEQSEDESHEVKSCSIDQFEYCFSEVLDHVTAGDCELVWTDSGDPIVVVTMAKLAEIVEAAKSSQRFSDIFDIDPRLPVGEPLTINEGKIGTDQLEL